MTVVGVAAMMIIIVAVVLMFIRVHHGQDHYDPDHENNGINQYKTCLFLGLLNSKHFRASLKRRNSRVPIMLRSIHIHPGRGVWNWHGCSP